VVTVTNTVTYPESPQRGSLSPLWEGLRGLKGALGKLPSGLCGPISWLSELSILGSDFDYFQSPSRGFARKSAVLGANFAGIWL